MKQQINALLALAALVLQSNALQYPGTETRPILSADEASQFTMNNYLSGWQPEEIQIPNDPDYVVKEGQSIQAVVNKAIQNGSNASRIYIQIQPGNYMQTVYIKSDVPLTIYGDSENPDGVHIMATLSASTSVEDYKNIVNENGDRYQKGDPAWDFYHSCATKVDTVGTECSMVFWVQSDNFQLMGVTVHNGATDAQAVALTTAGDKIHLMNNNFLGYQDTVGLGITYDDDKKIERVLVHMCYIEGQVDYVYGDAVAVFNMVTFNTVAIRENKDGVVFAPDTAPNRSYGFLVIDGNFTGDASYKGTNNKVRLARSWDHGVTSADLYVPGESPNGQLVIRDSNIDNIVNVEAPYGAAATSRRPFSADISTTRDLDNNNYNRMWEFNNSGGGA